MQAIVVYNFTKSENGGEGEIRTREPLRVTRFPSARTRPTMRPLQIVYKYELVYYTQKTLFLQVKNTNIIIKNTS